MYHETAPAHGLNTLLWLEADRFANLGASISQEKIDIQRDVVLNEMRQSVLDEPGGAAYEAASSALFPKSHPYFRPVIGSIADLQAATRADVVDFFTRYYTPSNLTLIVVGDVDTKSVQERVTKLHGQIPSRTQPVTSQTTLAPRGVRCRPCRQQFVDAVGAPRVSTTYRWNADRLHGRGRVVNGGIGVEPEVEQPIRNGSFVNPSLELVAAMANDSFTSQLQIALTRKRKVANWVAFSYDPKELSQMFSVEAEAAVGISAEQLRTELDDALGQLAISGFTEVELTAAKIAARGGLADQMEEPNGQADVVQDVVTRYGATSGQPSDWFGQDAITDYGRRFRTVTATSATRALRSMLRDADRVEQVVRPGPRGGYPAVLTASSGTPSGRLLRAPKPITMQRQRDAKPARIRVPNPRTDSLANGVRMAHFVRPDAPTIEVVLMINGGGERDPAGKEGRGALMAALMTRGSAGLDATEFSEKLAGLGSAISVNGSADRYTVSVSTPPQSLEPTLGLLADVLVTPTFDADEVSLAIDETVASIESQQTDPGALAFYAGVKDFFPAGDAVTRFATVSSMNRISADDLRTEHRMVFQPQNTEIVTGGPITTDAIRSALDRALRKWKNSGPAVVALTAAVPATREMHTVLVDVPGASQTQVLYFAAGPNPADPSIIAANSSAFILGGAFTSRLNRSLREEKGYTYGASAGLSLGEQTSLLQASTSVEQSVTGPAITELLRIIHGFDRGDVTTTETASATAATYATSVDLVSTNVALVYTYASLRDRGLNWDQVEKRLDKARSLTQADLSIGARSLIDNRRVTLTIAGDLSKLRSQLADLDAADLGTITETTVDLN